MEITRTHIFKSILVLSFVFVHCAREVIIDLPDEETRIVAICHFTNGQPFKVHVSLSRPVYDSRDPIVPEAVDLTLVREGALIDKLFRATTDNGELYWESHVLAEAGVTYAIDVRITGFPDAGATSAIPEHHPLAPATFNPADISETPLNDGRRLLNIPLTLHVQNLPAEQRYFAFYLKHDLEVGQYENGEWVTDFTYEGLPTNYSADGRTLSLLHDLAEPVVLINDNFWSDNRDTLLLDARIPYEPSTEKPRRIYLEWRTLSEEFYRYHLSLSRQGSSLPLSDPDAVFNNVEGGYGNFSGYAVGVDTIELPF